MNQQPVSMQEVLDGLLAEGLLPTAAKERANTLINDLRSIQPWYVRTMVGFGAWLASLMLISSVAGISLAADGGTIVIGLAMIGAAIALRRRFETDFIVQSTLAFSLAGQALFAYGIADLNNGNDFEQLLMVVVVMSVVLFVVFPDRIHRVLSILLAAGSLASLIYAWEWNAAIPFLGPGFAAALVYLHQRQARFMAGGKGAMIRPLMNGLMLSAFGCLLISTVYVLPELVGDFVFYPRPWISTLLLGGLFLYLSTQIWSQLVGSAQRSSLTIVYGLTLVLIGAAWLAPGMLLALLVIQMGAASGSRLYVGAGIGFLAVFIGAYFYGIDISMLAKSISLIATGATILLARWLILRLFAQPDGGSENA